MRGLTPRGVLATLMTAAVVVPFIGYPIRGSMPFVQDPRAMAGVVVVGIMLAFAVFGRRAVGTGTFELVKATLVVLAPGFAIAALIAATFWALLVPAMAGLVIMWAWLSCTTQATSHPDTRSHQWAVGPALGRRPTTTSGRPEQQPGNRAGRALRECGLR